MGLRQQDRHMDRAVVAGRVKIPNDLPTLPATPAEELTLIEEGKTGVPITPLPVTGFFEIDDYGFPDGIGEPGSYPWTVDLARNLDLRYRPAAFPDYWAVASRRHGGRGLVGRTRSWGAQSGTYPLPIGSVVGVRSSRFVTPLVNRTATTGARSGGASAAIGMVDRRYRALPDC